MSEEMNPDVMKTSDVLESAETETVEKETVESPLENLADKTLAELSQLFEKLSDNVDRMKMSKEAEAIKSAFYKRLRAEKQQAGVESAEAVSADEDAEPAEENNENLENVNPFQALENGFKSVYAKYKKERAEYNKQQDALREENLVRKQAVVEELKSLVEGQDDLSSAFPAFRELQKRWRETGPVPVQNFRNLNDTYQFYVEQFYDKVQINKDLRDLDFKKNLEVKEDFCKQAENLSESGNVVDAFKELQKLHEQWKEYGPVAKEYREQIWDRFKAATAVINKKYQAYFEDQKAKQAENLVAKTALCEKVEAIADKEDIKSSNEWNSLSKAIEDIQKEWKTIGFASKKENQKIYDRFRAACDKFFARKREFYLEYKDSMNGNIEKKMAIIEEAESIKGSTDWKKTADRLIALQAQWKEVGAVPRKKSEQLWKRFRAACDEFFAAREQNSESRRSRKDTHGQRTPKQPVLSEKARLVKKYRDLEQQIETYENNILLFSKAQALQQQMQERIDAAKKELEELEKSIRAIEASEN